MVLPRSTARLLPAFLAILAALVICCASASSARADAAQVTVVSPGGASQTLALGALAGSEDLAGRPYALRSATGESSQAVIGFSLAKILEAAGADPYGFSYLEVQRPAGGAVQLSRHQALDPGAFAEGPPAVYATATGTGFLRPSTGPEDFNASDSFDAPQGVSLILRKGKSLQVRAQASTVKTRPGETVDFSAVVEQAGAGEELTYSWYFDDGHGATSASPRHSFAERGSYDVVVGVTTPGDDTGSSDVVTIQVGAPVAGGPDRKGGGGNRAADAPDHGVADGPSTGIGIGSGAGPTPPATSAPAEAPPPSPTRTEKQKDPEPTPPAPARDQIEGELLSASGTVTPEVEKEQAAARTGQLEGDGGGGALPTAAWGLLTVLGLLGTGALIEAGGVARLWPPRGRSA